MFKTPCTKNPSKNFIHYTPISSDCDAEVIDDKLAETHVVSHWSDSLHCEHWKATARVIEVSA